MNEKILCIKWEQSGELIDGYNCGLRIDLSPDMGLLKCGDCLAGNWPMPKTPPKKKVFISDNSKGYEIMKKVIGKITGSRAENVDGRK